MSPRLIQVLLGLSLLLNCFVLAGFVYRSWIAPPTFETRQPGSPPPPGARPSPIDALVHDLDVDSGQREALRGLLDGYTATRRERLREIQKVREQTAAELKKPQIDMARIDGLVDQIARLRADVQKEIYARRSSWNRPCVPTSAQRLHVLLVERFAGTLPPRPPQVLGPRPALAARRSRSAAMSLRLDRRGFVTGAAALSAGLWPALPAAGRPGDGLRRGAAAAVAHRLRRDAGRNPRPRSAGLCRRGRSPPRPCAAAGRHAGADLDRRGQPRSGASSRRPRPTRKPGVDGKPLQIARPVQEQGRELRNWWVEEMLVTDQPLVERMVMFWHSHFTSSMLKVRYAPALFRQNALFRREALGNFATLLKDVARDPAMLIYLDGMRNVARQPNENFARELLELFTLGEGHYSEADIKAAARAFTGWTVNRETGQFVVRPPQRDDSEKTFLGQTGRFGGDEIIAILLKNPRTAETIVEKMWREFVSLQPDPAEVKKLAASFRQGGYEIKPLLRALLMSQAFRDPANRGSLIKSPVELIVGTVHVLGLPVQEKTQLVRMMQGLGQVPFDPPNVKGWPGGESWITTYTLLLRQQFLRRIVEATSVASTDGGMAMRPGPDRRVERRQQLPDEQRDADDGAGADDGAAPGRGPQPAQRRRRGASRREP